MVHADGPVGLDGVAVAFDDERAVADAGIVLAATLAQRLGIEALVDQTVDLGDRPGAANAGREGHDAWCRRWRSARTASTTATCCAPGGPARCSATRSRRRRRSGRSCARSRSGMSASSIACWPTRSRAHGRRAPARATGAWSSMSTRSSARFIGRAKQGAAFGYTRVSAATTRCSPPAPDTGEVLHIRLRKGSANTSRGMLRFCDELIARVAARGRDRPEAAARRLGVLVKQDVRSPGPRRLAVLDRRPPPTRRPRGDRAIDEDAWTTLEDYPPTSDRADRRDRRSAGGGWSSAASARSIARASCCPPGSSIRS